MIVFNLKCAEGHGFEEWFASSADSEERLANHDVACPQCGDTHIAKTLSAPRINTGINSGTALPAQAPCGLPACGAGPCAMMPDA
jgi:hypothetical protein